jgi:PTH1 family peptidyl-tRNA hydrolase
LKLLVGLGNHGGKYDGTRHNLGWMALVDWMRRNGGESSFRRQDKFSAQFYSKQEVGAIFPETYMNRSGEAVLPFMQKFGLEAKDVIVLHDDLDLPPCSFRLKFGGGTGGHNGLRSMVALLGDGFMRIRLGIGKPEDPRFKVENWVLSRFGEEEISTWTKLMPNLCEAVDLCLAGKAELAMNKYNRRESQGK